MENSTSPGYENLKEPEFEMSADDRQYPDSKTSSPCYLEGSADDLFLNDFSQECFVLNEEYVLMEGEYVMWEGTAPCQKKGRKENFDDIFEEEALSLPEEDSLHHVGKYFTLKTGIRSHRIS